jgi:hypothetical protein
MICNVSRYHNQLRNHNQQQEGMDDEDMVFMMMRKINANEWVPEEKEK